MAGSAGSLGSASVDIVANMEPYDRALSELPAKSRTKIASAMQAIQAQMRRNKIEIEASITSKNTGWFENIQRLQAENDKLAPKLVAVQNAAIKQAEAIRQASAAAASAVAAKKAQAQAEKDLEKSIQRTANEAARAEKLAQAAMTRAEARNARIAASAEKAAQREIAAAQRTAKAGAGGGIGGGGKGGKGGKGGGGNRLQVLAQGLDDLQYVPEMGLRPILNNLIQLSPAIGIVGLALQQVVTHWTDIAKAFNLPGGTKTQIEQLEELAKKVGKVTGEVERLNKANAVKNAAAAQEGARSEKQEEQTSGVNQAIADSATGALSGRENIAGSLAVLNRERYMQNNPMIKQLQTRIADMEDFGGPKAKPAIDKLNMEIDGRVMDAARHDLSIAAVEPTRLESMIKQMNDNPHLFDQKTREAFERSRPGTKEADEKSMMALDQDIELEHDAEDRRKRTKADREKKAREAMPGMEDQFRPAILANIARGHNNDPAALAAGVSRQMNKQADAKVSQYRMEGRSEEDIAGLDKMNREEITKVAPEVAKMLLKSIAGEVQGRASADKVDTGTAAERELRDKATEARSKAQLSPGKMGSLESFAANLQLGVGNGNPMEEATLAEARKQNDTLQKLYDETVKKRNKDVVAKAVGPA